MLPQRRVDSHRGPRKQDAQGRDEQDLGSCSQRIGSSDNKPEPPDQTLGALHLALFEMAPGFETVVIVFHDPAVFIPPDVLGIPVQAPSRVCCECRLHQRENS